MNSDLCHLDFRYVKIQNKKLINFYMKQFIKFTCIFFVVDLSEEANIEFCDFNLKIKKKIKYFNFIFIKVCNEQCCSIYFELKYKFLQNLIS